MVLGGGSPGGDKQPGSVELGLEAHAPGLDEGGPEGVVHRALVGAELIRDDELGVLESVAVADDEIRIDLVVHPEEVTTEAILWEGLPQGESIDDVDCSWGKLETLADDGLKT